MVAVNKQQVHANVANLDSPATLYTANGNRGAVGSGDGAG